MHVTLENVAEHGRPRIARAPVRGLIVAGAVKDIICGALCLG